MGKEDVSAKKRRKLNSSSSATESNKHTPVDVYKVKKKIYLQMINFNKN